jgi:type VI protein secretion system component Hcp
MFPMNLLRRSGRDNDPTKDEASRTRSARRRRNPIGLEPLEERQLLAINMFMLIGDGTVVKGSTTAPEAPKGSFELSSFSWGVSNPLTDGGRAGTSQPSAPDFSITKTLDTASVGLFQGCTTAQPFSSARILVFQVGGPHGTPVEILEYDLTNLVVTSAHISGGAGEAHAAESDTFSFTKIQINFWTITSSGTQGTESSASWDFTQIPASVSTLSTSTAGVGASNGLDQTTAIHTSPSANASHKAKAAEVNHRLATHKIAGTQLSKTHRISTIAQRLVHGNQVAGGRREFLFGDHKSIWPIR